MKKLIAITSAILMLAGCASVPPEEAFVQELHAGIVAADTVSDRTLISVGANACEALEAGLSEAEIVDAIPSDSGFTNREIALIVGASHKYLCPEV